MRRITPCRRRRRGRCAPRTPPVPSPFLGFLAWQLQIGLTGNLPCLLYNCGEPSLLDALLEKLSREGSHAILSYPTSGFPVQKRLRALPERGGFAVSQHF